MRNPKRINVMLRLIEIIWEKQPDTRFNQLIHNLQTEYCEKSGRWMKEAYEKEEWSNTASNITSYRQYTHPDLFSLEDDEFTKFLEQKVKSIGR